jgi:hypothetical protein
MKYVIPVSAILLFFSSCADNAKSDLAVLRAADEGLRQAIVTISITNSVIYKAFNDRLINPDYSEKAKIWQPKAMLVKILSDSIVRYIGEVKSKLNSKTADKPDDVKYKELFEKLVKYRQDMLSIDPALNKEFSQNLLLFANGFDYKTSDSKIFKRTFFNVIPMIACMAMLSKFENNVKIIEHNFITFCFNQSCSLFCGIREKFWPMISQSSNYLKAGDKLEITAGIGSFNYQTNPQISINNKIFKLDEAAIAVYKFNTPKIAGKYSVPVKIEYTKPDGTKESMTKNIEYTVINPNQNPQ